MFWWLALGTTAVGALFLFWHTCAGLENPNNTATEEEKIASFGWRLLLGLAAGLLVLAIVMP